MEGVAAAASVAGILGLVGQTIDGLEKLKEFHARLTTASKTVDKFVQDIKSLLQALHGIEEILADWPGEKANVHTASLRVQVEACSKDTFDWLKKAQELRVGTDKGGKAWFKKFWIATSKNKVKDIRLEISRHRNALHTSLALIGRSLDVNSSQQLQNLDEKMDGLALLPNFSLNLQQRMSRDLAISRKANSLNSARSSRSLASIASSLSRLEALIPPAQRTPACEATEDESQDDGANNSNILPNENTLFSSDGLSMSLTSSDKSDEEVPARRNEIPVSKEERSDSAFDFLKHRQERIRQGRELLNAPMTELLGSPMRELFNSRMTDASTQTVSEASSSGLEMIELRETLNGSNLLGYWSSTQDRINRWLLHSLVTDETQNRLHRSQMPQPDLDEPAWLRLILRYWFIDEAATGVEIAYSLSGGAVGSRTGSSLASSESSEYYSCEEGFEVEGRLVRERNSMSDPPYEQQI